LCRLIEIEEQGLVEKLVAHAPVEALDKAILHRLAGGDEVPVDLAVPAPSQHGVAGELGAVVADDHARLAAPFDDRCQLTRHGRCRRGTRLRVGVPHGHWKTTTFVGALTTRGFIAPWVLDGPINRDAFETYVAKVLVPELRPGDTVIMDNLSSRKGPRVRQMIETAGAELRYLPPYSPDFNPIENAFAKLKALLRKAAERTINGLWDAIGRIIDLFPPAECANYFRVAGYDADWSANALAGC
jgi:transposase